MTNTADPAQPRWFDHRELIHMPEYFALRKAIDAFGRALDCDDDPPIDRGGFVKVCADMARTSYAADDCDCCDSKSRSPRWPIVAVIADGWMNGTYICPRTRKTWKCGYATPDRLPGEIW